MFLIRNTSDNQVEIDIFGSIGEDWFGEGNTLETVSNQIRGLKEFTANIASLGGAANEALAIYDLFKSHPYKITADIVGATASAGSVIAMGADYVKSSENALHLGHKALMGTIGNAKDHRRAADQLDIWDSRIINIYKKKSGKTKAEVEQWLDRDEWVAPEEGKAFGIIDEVYKPKKVLNSAELEELSKIHELPQNFNKMDNNENSLKASILNVLGFKNDETIKIENETLKTKVTELEGKVVEVQNAATLTSEIETLKGEITNKTTELDSLKSELETAKAEIQNKATEIEKLKANGIVTNFADPDPSGEDPKPAIENPFKMSDNTKQLFEQAKYYKENK